MNGGQREVLYLRIPEDLKRQVDAYATQRGMPVNAAGIVLLTEGLRAERKRDQ